MRCHVKEIKVRVNPRGKLDIGETLNRLSISSFLKNIFSS
jgi:hypothetical protein